MIKTRIAPSPTGDPHVGTAYQALYNFVFAKQNAGHFIVRIEDTDRARFNPESQKRILEMLEWLGLAPDESPEKGGPSAPYVQTERAEKHQAYANQMIKTGKAYRAFDTPAELEERRKASEARKDSYRGYDRRDRDLSVAESETRAANGEPFAIRLKVPLTGETIVKDRLRGDVVFKNAELDDKVLLKADGFPTYHLAAMCDDHDMAITHVIRAEEWLVSTPIHILIFEAFGWNQPEWIHTPWLLNADKTKLSKRKGDVSVDSYKAKGLLPEALLNYLGMMGWSMPDAREIFGVPDMIEHFSWERVSLGGSVFDFEKLTWLNGKYIREVLNLETLVDRAKPFLERAGFDVSNHEYVSSVVQILRERFNLLSELPQKVSYFFQDIELEEKAAAKLSEGLEHLRALLPQLEAATAWDQVTLEPIFKGYAETNGAKLGAVMQPLRAALTGRLESPGMFEVLMVLGKNKVLERIKNALA
jgi:glutamyl-tRNA synthetase